MATLATPGRWLRHKTNGTIYGHNDILAKNPAVEEVPEEIAFPEKHIPVSQTGRESKIDLSTDDTVVETVVPKKRKIKSELSKDASKGLKK
tara:strand:+ start:1094 stop:1366 length:273 start_codon:yes stop_codon:yes gene_type:complete